ncbi:Single-stranded-DNA-specific exonuclease RecJ [Planctomycetales bacterium 10988]|nr:Single-stranded-DNA-specific exonuclease RecJ [Planctomycetales bacterium 10988]
MSKKWRIRSCDPERSDALARKLSIPSVVAQMLLSRGLEDPERARQFLEAKLSDLRDPEELPGVPGAVEVIYERIQSKERIAVFGDYDVDGMSATALLCRCLKLLGANVRYYIPNRQIEGYGLNSEAIKKLAKDDTRLIITVDCGITAIEAAEEAKRQEIELVITDHHQIGAELPPAAAWVHPALPGSSYPFTGLSGVGVAFKLAWALCKRASNSQKVSERMRSFLLQAMGLTALGTIADVVPLLDENRILVRHGLSSLSEYPLLGISQLLQTAQRKKPMLESEDLAFAVAPRLNAAGRFGQALLAVELLETEDEQRAKELANYLDELNVDRQKLERSIYLSANNQIKEQFDPQNDAALVLGDPSWHSGVIGIVAGRLAEKYHRPVILLAMDEYGQKPSVGSARSIPGFHLCQALEACQMYLIGYGGHAAAAGLRLVNEQLDAFREAFCEYAEEEIATEDLQAEIFLDGEVPLHVFTPQVVDQIDMLAPFGEGNRRPLWCSTGVRLADKPKRIGGGGRHLALRIAQYGTSFRAVAFGGGDWEEPLSQVEGTFDIAFKPVINTFRGRRDVELHLEDWQVSTPSKDTVSKQSTSTEAEEEPFPF